MSLNPDNDPGAADPQAQAVYSWERDFPERRVGPQVVSREECEGVARRAAAFLGMAQPAIAHTAMPGVPCLAYPRRHALRLAEWGRNQVTVLHEVAHLATWPRVLRGEAPHGPGFVTMAIVLYERFLPGVDGAWLESTARMRRLDFYPRRRPPVAPRGEVDLFPGDF